MKFKKQEITVGADPEILLTKQGSFVSAHGLVKGSKNRPSPVKGGAVQVDGMALEFNINPAKTIEEFTQNIRTVYQQLRKQVPSDFTFSDQATAHFDFMYFSERSKEETRMGCEKDYNAYTGSANTKPDERLPIRTAGGHIHLGWREGGFLNDKHIKDCELLTKMCDLFLGLPSVLFDTDTERRSMYGAAGCYRPKIYGVEYRTLSNAWINSKELTEFMYRNIELMFSREKQFNKLLKHTDKAVQAINNSDTKLAKSLLKELDIPIFGG
jgi:hypothetical protein